MTPLPLAAARADRLRRGINLSHWFSQIYRGPGYVPAHFDTYIRVSDFALIRDMGFDHVRFPVNCEPIMAASADGRLPAEYIARIRARVHELHDHGLSVIIDVHPEDSFKHHLGLSDHAVSGFVSFWEKFAAELSHLDPESTLFEVLNEPCVHNAMRWKRIQDRAVEAIRSVAPRHTLVVTGDQWSLMPDLLALEPPSDRNIIANFHLYDPHVFTHQGAGWVGSWAHAVKDLPYPAEPRAVQQRLQSVTDADARKRITDYTEAGWGPQLYRDFLTPAVDWARARGLCLMCNEFGTYKKFSPRESRLAWVRDVSAALTANGIGWTMWDYAGDFSVVQTDENGVRVPDRELVDALGLSSPVPIA